MDALAQAKNRQDFVRLAQKRVTKALNHIRLIGNLSNTSNYSYTERDVEKIFTSLENEIAECKKRFEAKQKAKLVFVLEDDMSVFD